MAFSRWQENDKNKLIKGKPRKTETIKPKKTMFRELKLILIARRLKRLKVTEKSNAQLRKLEVVSDGQVMKVLDYIEKTAEKMPKIEVNGKPIDVERRMKELYYKHGLKGLNLYVDYIRLRTAIELKKQKKTRNLTLVK